MNVFFLVAGIGLGLIGAGIDGFTGAGIGWLVGSLGGVALTTWLKV